MAVFRLSRLAEADMIDIGDYTLRTRGMDQTIRYVDDLENCCQRLANNPALGQPCDLVRPGLRRIEQGLHVMFFRQEPGGVFISRVLHERMMPEQYMADDD